MKDYAVAETERAFTRAARRETLREAVLACNNALACGASQFRLRGEEGFLCLGSITGCDCLFDLANESTNARATSLVDVGTAGDLAGRFFSPKLYWPWMPL